MRVCLDLSINLMKLWSWNYGRFYLDDWLYFSLFFSVENYQRWNYGSVERCERRAEIQFTITDYYLRSFQHIRYDIIIYAMGCEFEFSNLFRKFVLFIKFRAGTVSSSSLFVCQFVHFEMSNINRSKKIQFRLCCVWQKHLKTKWS